MTPIMLTAECLKIFFEQSPHPNNALRHPLDFAKPLLVQFGVVQDLGGDTSTMNWRIGV